MNKISKIVIGFVALVFANTAFADSSQVKIIDITDEYNNKTVYKENPVTSCKEVDVPIYKQNEGQGSLGDFLAGAIIGGAIGNQVGDSKGNGAIGAIIGGAIANESAKKKNGSATIVGYKRERVCETTVTRERAIVSEYMRTRLTFVYQGKTYTVSFQK